MPPRADLKALFALAIPVATVNLGLMGMGVVDTIMVGHVSAVELAGVALGNLYWFAAGGFGFGTLMALDPLISQAVGARDDAAVARGIQRGLVLCLVMCVPAVMLFLPAGAVLRLLGQPLDVVPRAAEFVHVSIAGILPFYAFVVLRQSLQALGRMRPIVIVIVGANLFNAALCWLFVFGGVGSLRGAAAVALASVIARWCMVFGLLAAAWRDLRPSLLPPRPEALAVAPLVSMFRLGAPIGVQYNLEFAVFGVVALLMGRLGIVPMAAHQIAINIASLTFMVPLGISAAASVLVGRAIGAGDPARARGMALAALICGMTFMALSGVTLWLGRRLFATAYTIDPAVIALTALLLPLAALFQVFDGLQVVSIGVLRGAGDTRTPMIANLLGFWLIGFPTSLWLAFRAGGGAVGLWWGLVAGLAAVAVFLVLRVRSKMAGELGRLRIDGEVI